MSGNHQCGKCAFLSHWSVLPDWLYRPPSQTDDRAATPGEPRLGTGEGRLAGIHLRLMVTGRRYPAIIRGQNPSQYRQLSPVEHVRCFSILLLIT